MVTALADESDFVIINSKPSALVLVISGSVILNAALVAFALTKWYADVSGFGSDVIKSDTNLFFSVQSKFPEPSTFNTLLSAPSVVGNVRVKFDDMVVGAFISAYSPPVLSSNLILF